MRHSEFESVIVNMSHLQLDWVIVNKVLQMHFPQNKVKSKWKNQLKCSFHWVAENTKALVFGRFFNLKGLNLD